MESHSRAQQAQPEPGQILIVIHDFSARSSDELSLTKGDRVELIERDDDFGDGWYLGRHLTTGSSGLFPEVYTRIAPRGPPSYPPTSSTMPRSTPGPLNTKPDYTNPPTTVVIEPSPTVENRNSVPTPDADRSVHASRHTSAGEVLDTSNTVPTMTQSNGAEKAALVSTPPPAPANLNLASAAGHLQGQDSPVMNETLSVIDEHITDMNSPHQSLVVDSRGINDSGSEYSSHVEHRMSYINGEETDEEEEGMHTREEVLTWTPDQVAEYLFTTGVETHHCEIFRDQEISGEVLLEMDQTSVFIKEFELGSVGRRLKTWQKIKLLQDEVSGGVATKRNTGSFSDKGTEENGRNRSRSDVSTTKVPKFSGSAERPGSHRNSRLSQQSLTRNNTVKAGSIAGQTGPDSPRRAGEKRPSAASIREMQHSRQNSGTDFTTVTKSNAGGDIGGSPRVQDGHKKQPSFDRNWTMGGATPPMSTPMPSRPLSSAGLQSFGMTAGESFSQSLTPSTNVEALERGYFSGGEVEGKPRNVLRKRTTSTSTHSRNSSYTDEQRQRSATAHTRHSRYGSVDSLQAPNPPSASQKYYGLSLNGRRRTPSENSINSSPRPPPPPKDNASPIVTKLEGRSYEQSSPSHRTSGSRPSRGTDWLLPVKPISMPKQFGLRAISDAVTGHEKAKIGAPDETDPASPVREVAGPTSPLKESPVDSPSARTGSTTPSAGPSFELEHADSTKNSSFTSTPGSARAARKKTKKETSAYTRGLEKKTPQEQMVGADYSGWMKKKSTNLMTTWKPRLFVLKGRRLSYYYSENDDQEKGLIDISFHRVLPADNDRLTGLHATLTGATSSPNSPSVLHTETIAAREAAAEPESTLSRGSGDTMFIFKLVPPRAGLSRAVTFTKPTVHYFAVPNIKQGRLWMAALMKATIDRDDAAPISSTYQQKTISLAKARAMRHRPPALMNVDEHAEEEVPVEGGEKNGLNIQGIVYDRETNEEDSGVSGVSKEVSKVESAGATISNPAETLETTEPRTA